MKARFIRFLIYCTFGVVILHAYNKDNRLDGEIVSIDNDAKAILIKSIQMGDVKIKILPNTYLIGKNCGIFSSNLEAKFKDLNTGLFVEVDLIDKFTEGDKIARRIYWYCGDTAY